MTPKSQRMVFDNCLSSLLQRPKQPETCITHRSTSYESKRDHQYKFIILNLPLELVYMIFDFLDPIDSVCLGLTTKRFYSVLRNLYGSVPLGCRRFGPNDLEWVFRNRSGTVSTQQLDSLNRSWSMSLQEDLVQPLRQINTQSMIRGPWKLDRGSCRHCGPNRCELHRHICLWMNANGPQSEYCYVREKFVPLAGGNAPKYCYLSKPSGPINACQRHYLS
jgi:hypothetical protein